MLVVTLGDPFGVMVELVARCWHQLQRGADGISPRSDGAGPAVLLVGSHHHWSDQWNRLHLRLGRDFPIKKPSIPVVRVSPLAENLEDLLATMAHIPIGFLDIDQDHDCRVPAEDLSLRDRGILSWRSLDMLRHQTFKNWSRGREKFAVVTGPVDKFSLDQVGFKYPGKTEFFEDLWQTQAVMILAGPRLKVGLVTNHHALREVPRVMTQDLVANKIRLFAHALQQFFPAVHPRLAVTGLNPHAGDSGKFGDEEQRLIVPAIEQVRSELKALSVEGPLPADTAFYGGYHGLYDGVLAMYHDQGLGPLKTVHFDEAVNISGGLPHLRISPDHGPARNLFLRGEASAKSLQNALDMALRYLGDLP